MKTIKISKNSLSNSKRNKPKIGNEISISTDYYKEPWFFNKENLDFQLNTMNSMFRTKEMILKKEKEKEKKNKNKKTPENQTSILTTESSLPEIKKLTQKELLEKKKKKKEDLSFYKNIFKVKALFKRRTKPINNVLNIRYAENEKIYEEMIKKENEALRLKNKPIKKLTKSHYLDDQIDEIKNKIKFMKCVEDFIYPGFVIAKIKAIDNMIKNNENAKNNKKGIINPLHDRILQTKNRQNLRKLLLTECIDIIQ
jgi:hypothetical protein